MNKFLFVLFSVLLLVGCGTQSATVPAFESPLIHSSPFSGPGTTEFKPTTIPAPAADVGSIVGRVVDFKTGEPARNPMPIFLGDLSVLNPSDSFVVTMMPTSSPRAEMDMHGYFAFLDVEPKTYAMVFWTPMNTWVIQDPETEKAILVTVNADEITDLGELQVDLSSYQ